MIYSNLVACSIDANEARFRTNRINLSNDAFAYENDKVLIIFDAESVYVLNFENDCVETHQLNIKLVNHSRVHKFSDSITIYFKFSPKGNKTGILEFETENPKRDIKKIKQFLERALEVFKKRHQQELTSCITSIIGGGLIVGLYFIYLTTATKAFPQLENYHFYQTAPIMIALVSTFVLIKSYIEKALSFHAVFFYSIYAFLISLGQMVHFQYLSSQNIPNVWNYYFLFLIVLLAPIAVSFIILLKRKRLQQYHTKVPSRLFETALILTLAAVVLAICMTVAPQSSLNIGIADYTFFSIGIFTLGIILSILLAFLLKKESKYTRIMLSTLLTILAFSLAFASSLNSANAYRTVYKEKKNGFWRIENKEGILIVQDENTVMLDGYKFGEFIEPKGIKILEIKRVDDKRYKLTVSYYGIVTDEFWEKDDKDKTLKYVSPVAKEVPEGVLNTPGSGIIIIKKAGTFEDVFSKRFSKKLGENTLTIETSWFVYMQEKGLPYITLRDKDNNVIIGGLYYDGIRSQKENKIIGTTKKSYDSKTHFEYEFNDDGTYSKKRIDLNGIETNLPKPEKNTNVLSNEQVSLYKSHASYEKQGRFHMVKVYEYDEERKKREQSLYFNDHNEYVTCSEPCFETNQHFYIKDKTNYNFVQFDEHFKVSNNKFNLQKLDREVYWEGKWYFTTYDSTDGAFKLYDENGDVVE